METKNYPIEDIAKYKKPALVFRCGIFYNIGNIVLEMLPMLYSSIEKNTHYE